MPKTWYFTGWMAFLKFNLFGEKPEVQLTCLTNKDPTDKKASLRAAARKKEREETSKKREASILLDDKSFSSCSISMSNHFNLVRIAQQEEIINQQKEVHKS
eukprot:5566453-Ditylum_brightwellii.AAC.1